MRLFGWRAVASSLHDVGAMRCAWLLTTAILLGGCAGEARDPADIANDPSWTPPGQGDLEVADAPPDPKAKPRAKKPRKLEEPNRRQTGSLHAGVR